MNYVLMGYMGAGKSTVGKALAKKLDLTYIDTDEVISEKTKLTISEIFEKYGEEYFRNLETDVIRELSLNASNAVVSLGGGLAVKKDNHEYIKNTGKVVYLRIKPETVFERLKGDNTRPLLRGPKDEVLGKIQNMIGIRGPIYEKLSDLTLDVDGFNVEEIVDIIKNSN